MTFYFKVIISVATGLASALLFIMLTVQAIEYYNLPLSKFNGSLISYNCMALTITIGIFVGRLCYGWLKNIAIDNEEKMLCRWLIIGSITSAAPAIIDIKFFTNKTPLIYHVAVWVIFLTIVYICRRLYLINISRLRGYSLWIVSYKANTGGSLLNYQLIIEAKNTDEAENEARAHTTFYHSDAEEEIVFNTHKINNEMYFRFFSVIPEGKKRIISSSIFLN